MSINGALFEAMKLTKVQDRTASAGTAINSDGVDMSGFDAVSFFTKIDTPNASNTINLAQSADDITFADLLGTSVSSGASDEIVWLDIIEPKKQFVRLEIDRGGANTAVGEIWAMQYKARDLPVTNVLSGTIIGEIHVSPKEGTA